MRKIILVLTILFMVSLAAAKTSGPLEMRGNISMEGYIVTDQLSPEDTVTVFLYTVPWIGSQVAVAQRSDGWPISISSNNTTALLAALNSGYKSIKLASPLTLTTTGIPISQDNIHLKGEWRDCVDGITNLGVPGVLNVSMSAGTVFDITGDNVLLDSIYIRPTNSGAILTMIDTHDNYYFKTRDAYMRTPSGVGTIGVKLDNSTMSQLDSGRIDAIVPGTGTGLYYTGGTKHARAEEIKIYSLGTGIKGDAVKYAWFDKVHCWDNAEAIRMVPSSNDSVEEIYFRHSNFDESRSSSYFIVIGSSTYRSKTIKIIDSMIWAKLTTNTALLVQTYNTGFWMSENVFDSNACNGITLNGDENYINFNRIVCTNGTANLYPLAFGPGSDGNIVGGNNVVGSGSATSLYYNPGTNHNIVNGNRLPDSKTGTPGAQDVYTDNGVW